MLIGAGMFVYVYPELVNFRSPILAWILVRHLDPGVAAVFSMQGEEF